MSQALERAGVLAGGKSPEAAAKSLLLALSARGFVGAGGGLAAQLSAALAALQRAHGLSVTGRLDSATLTLLQNLGVLPKDVRMALGVLGVKDGFEGSRASSQEAALYGRVARGQGEATNQTFLQGVVRAAVEGSQKALELFLGLLGLGRGGEAAASSAGAQIRDDAALSQRDESRAAAEGKARVDGTGLAKDVPGFASREGALEKNRASGPGRKRPTERGLDEEGDPDDEEGRGEGERGASQGEGEGGVSEEGAHAKGSGDGDPFGTERHAGNATSGDFDTDDERRGHAHQDDGSDAPPGYYEVPLLSVQVEAALEAIRRDESTTNRATTYTWDVTLHRPGVYAPGQKPEALLHLVVKEATAFDRAWPKAVEKIASLLARFEPDADPPTKEDVLAAIRRARMRGED